MYERNDGLMRGSREERVQTVYDLQEQNWEFDTLLGIIQGFLVYRTGLFGNFVS